MHLSTDDQGFGLLIAIGKALGLDLEEVPNVVEASITFAAHQPPRLTVVSFPFPESGDVSPLWEQIGRWDIVPVAP